MGLLLSLVVLSVLIFFHELGHFSVARYFGVRVNVFSIGFGKTLYKKVIGETEWRISAIPLGGYVKMKGQDDADPSLKSDDPDSYNSKTPLQKIAILLAGPFANFLLALIIYIGVAFSNPPTAAPHIGSLLEDSPAVEAGLLKDDKIIAINGTAIATWRELTIIIKETRGDLDLIIKREGLQKNILVHPRILQSQNIFGEMVERRMVGITPNGDMININYGVIGSFEIAMEQTYNASKLIVQSLEKLISGIVGLDQIGGVISIVDTTAKASEYGFIALLMFSALLSVNLGVLNLLPIPALDGGHIMFNLYELITRHTPSEKAFINITIVGWVMLGSLMLLGIYNDINRLIAG
jgi:regulator of sigma E protease